MEQFIHEMSDRRKLFMAKQQKIRIRLKSYDHKALDQSAAKIVDNCKTQRCISIRSNSIAN